MNCPQAWHTGLHVGLLVECNYEERHRGWHRNRANDLAWGGKLTDEEMAIAETLRKAYARPADRPTHEPDKFTALAATLRARHWGKDRMQWDDGRGRHRIIHVCNQDGQEWPCYTERTIREIEDQDEH